MWFRPISLIHMSRAVAVISATAIFALAGISYIGTLLVFPPRVAEETDWPIVDKRWLIASYLLVVALIYAPAIFRRLFGIWRDDDKPGAVPGYCPRPLLRRLTYSIAASVVGFPPRAWPPTSKVLLLDRFILMKSFI